MIKAVIFDMDGVISDTEKLHAQIESELLGRFGINITPTEIAKRFSGVRTHDFFKDLLKGKVSALGIMDLLKEKWDRATALAEKEVEPMPGAIELIEDLRKHGFKLALASASNLRYVKVILSKLKITDKFQAITAGDEVEKGKPDPEVFLTSARKLSVKPEECVVIEDGVSGMIAAKKAGMKCVGLVSDDDNYPADITVRSLKELSAEKIRKLT